MLLNSNSTGRCTVSKASKSRKKYGDRKWNQGQGQVQGQGQGQSQSQSQGVDGSQWLWVVRLFFDRRAVVRIIALELIDIILRNSPEADSPTLPGEEKGFRVVREEGEEVEEVEEAEEAEEEEEVGDREREEGK